MKEIYHIDGPAYDEVPYADFIVLIDKSYCLTYALEGGRIKSYVTSTAGRAVIAGKVCPSVLFFGKIVLNPQVGDQSNYHRGEY